MNAQKNIEIASMLLAGRKPPEIAAAAGISLEALGVLRKSKAYRKTEQLLAGQMLERAGSELQGLAVEAVEKLRSIMRVPMKNLVGTNGTERRRADPNLLREQRQAALAVIEMAAKTAEKQADTAESKALDRQLLRDVDDE
jgi:hypothetical protein